MRKLVVIVEDTETIAPLEIALASLIEVETRQFSNGREAITFLANGNGDVAALITDLHLPFFDGFQLVASVRANPHYKHLPIIVLSGDAHPETPGRLRDLGVNAFFAKPYSPGQVRATLESLLHAT